MLRKRKSTINN